MPSATVLHRSRANAEKRARRFGRPLPDVVPLQTLSRRSSSWIGLCATLPFLLQTLLAALLISPNARLSLATAAPRWGSSRSTFRARRSTSSWSCPTRPRSRTSRPSSTSAVREARSRTSRALKRSLRPRRCVFWAGACFRPQVQPGPPVVQRRWQAYVDLVAPPTRTHTAQRSRRRLVGRFPVEKGKKVALTDPNSLLSDFATNNARTSSPCRRWRVLPRPLLTRAEPFFQPVTAQSA